MVVGLTQFWVRLAGISVRPGSIVLLPAEKVSLVSVSVVFLGVCVCPVRVRVCGGPNCSHLNRLYVCVCVCVFRLYGWYGWYGWFVGSVFE